MEEKTTLVVFQDAEAAQQVFDGLFRKSSKADSILQIKSAPIAALQALRFQSIRLIPRRRAMVVEYALDAVGDEEAGDVLDKFLPREEQVELLASESDAESALIQMVNAETIVQLFKKLALGEQNPEYFQRIHAWARKIRGRDDYNQLLLEVVDLDDRVIPLRSLFILACSKLNQHGFFLLSAMNGLGITPEQGEDELSALPPIDLARAEDEEPVDDDELAPYQDLLEECDEAQLAAPDPNNKVSEKPVAEAPPRNSELNRYLDILHNVPTR